MEACRGPLILEEGGFPEPKINGLDLLTAMRHDCALISGEHKYRNQINILSGNQKRCRQVRSSSASPRPGACACPGRLCRSRAFPVGLPAEVTLPYDRTPSSDGPVHGRDNVAPFSSAPVRRGPASLDFYHPLNTGMSDPELARRRRGTTGSHPHAGIPDHQSRSRNSM